jgi:hypothetical protein
MEIFNPNYDFIVPLCLYLVKNMKKMLLQMQSGFLQLASTLFRFVLLTILTPGIHFKFKLLGFCNLLLIKWFSRWNMT